jgi:hypothetical protein
MTVMILRRISIMSTVILLPFFSARPAEAADYISEIVLRPGISETVLISKVPVFDSRAVRGFLGTPVDGTVHTRGYRGEIVEYPDTGKEGYDAGAGVDYSYNGNDGLHIKFGDSGGFDAVVIRGAARTEMFENTGSLLEPEGIEPLAAFEGNSEVECAGFSGRTGSQGVSFFGTDKGALADIGFYRISRTENTPLGRRFSVSTSRPGITEPESDFAPESIIRVLEELYPQKRGRHYSLEENAERSPDGISLSASAPVHLMSPPFDEKAGVTAVTLDFSLESAQKESKLTLLVQDPLDPRLSMIYVPLSLKGNGVYSIHLDFPDQVIFEGGRLWITILTENDLKLSGPDGGSPSITICETSVEQAHGEAFAYRKFLLKSLFIVMSESRPWGRYRKQSRDEFYASYHFAGLCPELFMTIDICNELAPEDDLVRQYREWVYLRNLDRLSDIAPPPTPPAGVPDWAWYPRMAWLESRKIAEWWLENRLVPTGEFGGMVGDDSDLYQQWADLPYYESDGVGAQVKQAAAALAELADKKHLRNGINVLMTDALHAYEDGINHLALMAQWEYGDPVYFERCMDSARYMEKLTAVTSDGRRHFRHTRDLGYDEIENPKTPTIEGNSTALMWHTSLQTAEYNRNPRAMKTLDEWAQSWLGKMEPGKWASEIEVLSGKVTLSTENSPFSSRAQDLTFTWLARLTGDTQYIEPFLYYYRKDEAPSPSNRFLGDINNMGFLDDYGSELLDTLAERNSTLSFYRSGFPSLLIEETIGTPESRSSAIGNLSDAIRWPDMYTTVEQYTDRLFPSIIKNASICSLGGYTARNRYVPSRGVSWEGFGTDYGSLVLVNRPDSLKVLIYSYADRPLYGSARIWSLIHGNYNVSTGTDSDGDRVIDTPGSGAQTELRKADTIVLRLEPKTVTVLEIGLVEKLDSIFERADLAVAARECSLDGLTVSGILHNIGSKDAGSVSIAVLDGNGEIVLKKAIGSIEAPLDLVPRRKEFSLVLPRKAGKNWLLTVDPENTIPEIYDGNNSVLFSKIK